MPKIVDTASPDAMAKALSVIGSGGIAAFPTETFYGLGVRYDDHKAIERLFSLKGRSALKAVPLIIGSVEALDALVLEINDDARRFIERYWPGPLTIVFHGRSGLDPLIAPEGRVALRMPGESFALSLAKAYGHAITATSANPSGKQPASSAQDVVRYFPEGLDIIIDQGAAPGGLPSTIIDTTVKPPVILRNGACAL